MSTLVQKELPEAVEALSRAVIGCALEVHRALGPGLLESIYEQALMHEFGLAGIEAGRQVEIDVRYKGAVLKGQRLDLLVGGMIVVEVKAVARQHEVHAAQLLSYLRAADLPLGLLFNFNVTWLREGMHRVFNERWSGIDPSRSSRPSR